MTVLVLLALALPTMQFSYDERAAQPPDTPSNLGLAAMADHFPPNQTLPDYLLIRSDHNMANTRDLAVLNSISTAVAKVDGVDQVRSITQPVGERLEPAYIAAQLGKLAKGLHKADRKLESGEPGLDRLASGAGDLGDALDQVSAGAGKAQDGAGRSATAADASPAALARPPTAPTRPATEPAGPRTVPANYVTAPPRWPPGCEPPTTRSPRQSRASA